ncbi:MAG: lysophospholipid acyltransferase family protein, partial [Nitrospiria bacterium]
MKQAMLGIHLFEYIAARIVILFLQFLPSGLSVRIGGILGRLFYYLDRRHRRVALDNLRTALGDGNVEKELRRIALSSFQNMGKSVVEFTLLPVWTRQRILEKVEIDGFEHYLAARAQEKGVILLS